MAAPPPRNTTYELIHHLGRGSIPKLEVPQVLSTIFDAKDYKVAIHDLPEEDLRMWVEALDQIIGSGICTEQLRRRTLRTLRKTCGMRRILPRSHYFPGKLFHTSNRPVGGGGSGDVWQVTDDRKHLYAAKVFRSYERDDHKIKRYYKEVTAWKRLNHPNLVPTLGAGPDIAELCVVSPWISDGHLLQYVSKHPSVNRVAITIGIADGLSYLHYNDAVHGDLKGENILFDNTGIPRISDFGSASLTLNPASMNASTPIRPTTIRWTAPEILGAATNNEAWRPTKMSDVYAFGMVVVEIFTGRYPFPDDTDLSVQLMVGKGKRPSKPADASKMGLSSAMWKLVEDCWNKRREKRPEIQYIAGRLPRS